MVLFASGVFAPLVRALVFKTSGGFEQSSQWVRFPYTPVRPAARGKPRRPGFFCAQRPGPAGQRGEQRREAGSNGEHRQGQARGKQIVKQPRRAAAIVPAVLLLSRPFSAACRRFPLWPLGFRHCPAVPLRRGHRFLFPDQGLGFTQALRWPKATASNRDQPAPVATSLRTAGVQNGLLHG